MKPLSQDANICPCFKLFSWLFGWELVRFHPSILVLPAQFLIKCTKRRYFKVLWDLSLTVIGVAVTVSGIGTGLYRIHGRSV